MIIKLMLPLEIKKMTLLDLLGEHVALCQANKNFNNSKPIFCKCGFLTNRRNFLSLVAMERSLRGFSIIKKTDHVSKSTR